MLKRTFLTVLAAALLLPAPAPAQTVEGLLAQARERYLAGAYPESVSLLLEAVSLIGRNLPLQVRELRLCERVDGYRDYKARSGFALALGEPFLLYFEVEGYNTLRDGSRYWISLAQDARVVDSAGKVLFEQKNWVVLKNDYASPVVPVFFTNRLTGMDKGTFTVTLTVRDEYKKKAVEKTFDFTVQ